MLKLSHISVSYEEEQVLEDISMVFKPGEVNVITGSSGSGKSTLIKLINGIIPQMTKANISGQMTYAKENLLKLDITARSHF
ncbi:MAG TPA: ATP-binding cassette domain-containing protein, partial [Tetragenococcus sp.]|nr:ATP-binding cassette domain-containing protein [Tetragenococcus sp.]